MKPHSRKLLLLLSTYLMSVQALELPAYASGSSGDCSKKLAGLYSTPRHELRDGLSEPIPALKKLSHATEWGPRIFVKLGKGGARPPEQISTLTLGQYNVLNLLEPGARERFERDFIEAGDLADLADLNIGQAAGAPVPVTRDSNVGGDALATAKPRHELIGVAETMKISAADVIVVEEVGSHELLEQFNREYLGSAYTPALIDGNDSVLQVGFLFKKDLPFEVEIQSFKNVADTGQNGPVFSRDLPVALVREAGADPKSPPRFIVAGSHFKSKRVSSPGQDTDAIRRKQAKAAAEVLGYYRRKFGDSVAVFFAADFNDDIRFAQSFEPLKQIAGFKDSFEMAAPASSVPAAQRITHTFHPGGAPTVQSQLDAILVAGGPTSNGWVKESKIVPYYDAQGNQKSLPRTFKERRQNPSDHFMIKVVIDYQQLRKPAPSLLPVPTKDASKPVAPKKPKEISLFFSGPSARQ